MLVSFVFSFKNNYAIFIWLLLVTLTVKSEENRSFRGGGQTSTVAIMSVFCRLCFNCQYYLLTELKGILLLVLILFLLFLVFM